MPDRVSPAPQVSTEGDRVTDYGFVFGSAEVTRIMKVEHGVCIGVETIAGQKVEIYASPAGRSLRVFKDGKEMISRG